MPRRPGPFTRQISFYVMPETVARADEIATAENDRDPLVLVTRSDVLRTALANGLREMEKRRSSEKKR